MNMMQDYSSARTTGMWEDNLAPSSCRKIGPYIEGSWLKTFMLYGDGCILLLEFLGC